MATLNLNSTSYARKLDERQFHNLQYSKVDNLRGLDSAYDTAQAMVEFRHDWIRQHVSDKVVLDYACGEGHSSIFVCNMAPFELSGSILAKQELPVPERLRADSALISE